MTVQMLAAVTTSSPISSGFDNHASAATDEEEFKSWFRQEHGRDPNEAELNDDYADDLGIVASTTGLHTG